MPPAPRSALVALTLLVLAALAVRSVGIDYGMPVWHEPDPNIPIHVEQLRRARADGAERSDPMLSRTQYPHLIARLTQLLPAAPGRRAADGPRTLGQHLRAAAHTTVQVRWVVALLSLLMLPATWALARRFVPPGWALFAAALTATSLLHVSFSQQARPHAAAAGFVALAVLAAVRLAQAPSWARYALAGLAAALAVGTLHSGVAVLLPLAAAVWLRRRERGGAFDPRALLAFGLVLVSVPLFYPFLFESSGVGAGGLRIEDGALRWADHRVGLDELDGRGFYVLGKSLWFFDPVLCLTALAGVASLVLRGARSDGPESADERRRAALVMASYALPYLLVAGLFRMTYERFALPLLPFLAVLGAWGLWRWTERFGKRRLALAVGLAVLAFPSWTSTRLVLLRSRPDTLDQAAAWLQEQASPEGDPVWLTSQLDLPLAGDLEAVPPHARRRAYQHLPWTFYQLRIPEERRPRPTWPLRWLQARRGAAAGEDLAAMLERQGPGWYLIEVYEQRRNHPLEVELRELLRERGERVARFAPEGEGPAGEGAELPFFFQLSDYFNDDEGDVWPHFAWRTLRAEAIGPVLEIWRLD